MRPSKSSVFSLKMKFKFVDDSMCVVCMYMYIFNLEMGLISHTVNHMILRAMTKLTKFL